MRFYNQQHRHYCGIDLHVKSMYVCTLVVSAACMFTWYWLADVCAAEGITFVLGHALAMKAIHGSKSKNDKIDSHKIAGLLRGGLLPQSYCLPSRDAIAPRALRRTDHGPRIHVGAHREAA